MTRFFLIAAIAFPMFAQAAEQDGRDPKQFEAEFVASDVFRSGSLVLPVIRRLAFEGHYFGGAETDAGFTGASWTFSRERFKLAPGFGAAFGSNQFTSSPAVSLRWEFEQKWFITQGLVVQSFRNTPIFEHEGAEEANADVPVGYVRPTISDGNHVSARWRRVTIGGTWEHIAFREGSEWKGGGRLAVRILPRVSGVLYVLAPGHTEWRAGILIHAPSGKE